jgi:hypothetical protein
VRCHVVIVLLLVFPGLLSAETGGGRAGSTLPDYQGNFALNLGLLTRHSGVIFSGTALRVEHLNPDSSTAVATTRITFRVQTAIRGVRPGQAIQIREWDGLWNSGERYRPGERVLLFLYPASRLGLTSPVGGRLGRFRVDDAGRVEVQNASGSGKRPKPIELRTFANEIRRAAKE